MGKQKIAIIDDNHDLVAILVEFFLINGFDSVGLHGISHIEQLVEVDPDLVILDQNMPLLSGTEIMELMRGTPV